MLFSRQHILRLARREHQAYMDMFDACFEALHSIARHYVLDDDVADDIVQEVMINLYENSDKLERINNLGGFLRIAIRNRSLNYLRELSIKDKNNVLYKEELEIEFPMQELPPAIIEPHPLTPYIESAIGSLPGSCRRIFNMRYKEGYKIKDISAMLSISEGAVKSQLNRAVSRIKKELEARGLTGSDLPFPLIILFFLLFL